MSAKNYCGILLAIFSVTLSSQLIYNYYKRRKRETRKEINEVIMFSNRSLVLRTSNYSRVMITNAMDRMLHYLHSPRCNIDICMYTFTNQDLCNAVMKLQFRGINIRLIVDADMVYSPNSCVITLKKYGIPIRCKKSMNLMHHKFCLIDTLAKETNIIPFVMMGSLNWTNQALNNNWEDVTVTSQRVIVQQYKEEFENLWNSFEPIVLT